MAAAPVRIEVSREELIKVLEKKQAETEKRFRAEVVEWRKQTKQAAKLAKQWAALWAKMSEEHLLKSAEGKFLALSRPSRYGLSWEEALDMTPLERIKIPPYPQQAECYDQRIEWLKKSSEDTIKMTYEQYEAALRGCW